MMGVRDAMFSGRRSAGELRQLRGSVRSALISDALDAKGRRAQCLDPALVPLRQGDSLVGYAFPVKLVEVRELPEVPYQGLLAAVDAIGPGEVFVAATEGARDVAIWGELVTTACLYRGAVGAVCEGFARDSSIVRKLEFPVFCRGTVPYDSNGRSEVVAHNVTVRFGTVEIAPGDLIVGDDDGVVVVPRNISDEVVEAAVIKGGQESLFCQAVKAGMSARQAFAKYGVL